MTSTPVTNLAQAPAQPMLVSKTGKLWIGLIGVLMIAFHWHVILRMGRIGLADSDWSHVLIIPLISIYYIHLHRLALMATPRRVCRWGLPLIVLGIVGYVLGIYPIRNDMAKGYSMILTLFGVCLLLLGPSMMRILWFPIAFLVFSIKVSDAIWSIVASKMQAIAAYGAVLLLEASSFITGMQAQLRGSTIDLDYGQIDAPTPMNVAEACAGMRMLMAFLALGVALAFLFPRRWWQRLIMIALAGPIAIFVNTLRVAVLGWLHLVNPELAHGDSHLLVGMFMLIPAAGLLMLVGWCLDKILIVEGKTAATAQPIAFERDPLALHLEARPTLRGVGLGAAIVLMLGIGYILLLNQQTGGDVIAAISGGLNTALMVLTGALFLGGVFYVWRSISKGSEGQQLAMSQGVVAGLLLVAALGQYSAINKTQIALTKLPLPLRHGIALSFPDNSGDWVLLHQDPKLSKDVESELGTKEYFNRFYFKNTDGLTTDEVKKLKKTTPTKLGERLVGWSGIDEPGRLAKVHITYYTGMLDTVPHVPDKCWIVAGQELIYRKEHTIKLSRADYQPDPDHPGMVLAQSSFGNKVRLPSDEIKAVIFQGGSPDGASSTALYFFLANGNAVASNHRVRFSFNLKDRYSYYCKVEVMFPGVNKPKEVERYAQDLLSNLMPDVMACLPDWTEVQDGTYPGKAEQASD